LLRRELAQATAMRPQQGGVLVADVYGKRVWYVKFYCQEQETTVLLSCHEAEHDLVLADGRTLRSGR